MAMDAETHMGMDMGHEQHVCPHCPPPMHEDCGAEATEACEYLERFDTDRRTAKTKSGDDPVDYQLALLASPESPRVFPNLSPHSRSSNQVTTPPGPSRNVLFCVYLK